MTAFITFEGIEGSGKTTQIHLLASKLGQARHRVYTTREPGGCSIADQIRSILLDPRNQALDHRAELLLYAAARAQHVAEVIRPALHSGQLVLCDRFCDATIAYQGYGRQLDPELIGQLNCLAAGDCRPDLTLLFDLPVEIGLGRALRREREQHDTSEGRFEREALEFHQRIRDGYLSLAAEEPKRFRIITAQASPEQVAQQVNEAIQEYLKTRGDSA